jgi:hypothetical protein
MALIKKIFSWFTFEKEFLFYGRLADLRQKINNEKTRGFGVKWIDNKTIRFTANISLGTAQSTSGFISNPIKVFAEVKKIEKRQLKIVIRSRFRIELVVLLVLSFVMPIGLVASDESHPLWLFGLLPFTFCFFCLIYRAQELNLMELVKSTLNLKEGPLSE